MHARRMTTVELTPWQIPSHDLVLPDQRTVHLWRFPLVSNACLTDILSTEEWQRARRLRAPKKARAFVVSRSCLRQIIGRYLQTAPQDIIFSFNQAGKPYLSGELSGRLLFNLSHSEDWGLCAVTRDREVGVDLEKINHQLAFEPLAQRFFSSSENAWLSSGQQARRRRTFFRLWARKEAWLKGKGRGFSEPELELHPGLVAGVSAYAGGWWVMNVPVTRGYVGAVATAGEIDLIERWEWTVELSEPAGNGK
ncbi:MAG: 4'-phosphopantetheinyl transferase family protein [Desulfuromonadales bacterium]